jgi:multiple sugar transport system substrate-binding protein
MPAFDSPLGVEAVDYFVGLVEDGLVVPHPESIDHNTNRELFISGQVPITIDGAFMKGLTNERNPDLDIGFLHLQDETGGHTTGGGFWAVGAGSEHKQMAFNFIQFLSTEEMARKYFLESGQAPFFDVYDHPEIQNDEFARVSGEILADPDTKPMPILPQSTELQKILVEQVQQVLLEGKDTAQALSEAAEGWREIIKANQ